MFLSFYLFLSLSVCLSVLVTGVFKTTRLSLLWRLVRCYFWLFVFVVMFICYCICLQSCLLGALWDEYCSCAVTERPHDASCLSVVSFKMHGGLCDKRTCTWHSTSRRCQSQIWSRMWVLPTIRGIPLGILPERLVWKKLPDGEKSLRIWLPVLILTEYMTVRDGQMDRQTNTAWWHRPHLCIALCGKNGHNFHHETFQSNRQWLLDQVTAPCSVYSEAGTACFSLFSDVCCLSSCYLKNTNVWTYTHTGVFVSFLRVCLYSIYLCVCLCQYDCGRPLYICVCVFVSVWLADHSIYVCVCLCQYDCGRPPTFSKSPFLSTWTRCSEHSHGSWLEADDVKKYSV